MPLKTTSAKPTRLKSPQNSKQEVTTDSIRAYLKEIGRIPLLTHAQELEYGKQIKPMTQLLEVKDSLTDQLNREPTDEEWVTEAQKQVSDLTALKLKQILRVGKRAKDRMVAANLRLVVSIAKKYRKRGVSYQDLIQEGSLGLDRAAEKFDYEKGYKFSTYATWWVRQAVTRAIADKGRTVRLPNHIYEKVCKIQKTKRKLSQQLGRSPSQQELADACEMSVEKMLETLRCAQSIHSLNHKVGKDDDVEVGEFIAAEAGECPLEQQEIKDLSESLLSHLTPQQREVLTLRFGLRDGVELSLAKVGKQMNISRERVRQIEREALAKIRKCARTSPSPFK